MANIKHLTSDNFEIIGVKNKALGLRRIQEPTLIFFKMTGCENCKTFEPIFVSLARTDNRISYGILNVTDNKNVVMLSRQTTTPISAVPTLIMYINGQPYARYNGTTNIQSLMNFVSEMLKSNIQQKGGQRGNNNNNMYDMSGAGNINYAPPRESSGKKSFVPEVGPAPSMKGAIKGYASSMEDEQDNRLRVPTMVIPWNTPWEAELNDDY